MFLNKLYRKITFKSDIKKMLWSIFPQFHISEDVKIGSSIFTADYFVEDIGLYIMINPTYLRNMDRDDIYDALEFAGDNDRYIEVYADTTDEARKIILDEVHRVSLVASESGLPLLSPRYAGDAGWDIVVSEETICQPNSYVDVPSELFMEMPNDMYGVVQARSSTSKKQMLVLPGVIDPSYRGRVYAMVLNLSSDLIVIKKGDRIAQMLFLQRVPNIKLTSTDILQSTARASNGFGSTGSNISDTNKK